MHPACVLLLVGLGADAGVSRDAKAPENGPKIKHVELSEEAVYGLRHAREGYIYDSPNFEAHVARDGVVSFQDKHGAMSFPFFPIATQQRASGPTLESTLRGYFDRRRQAKSEARAEVVPPRRMEPSEICPPTSSCYVLPQANAIGVSGSFDLTDEIMRGFGQDPYAREKARFLSATFEFRIKMAVAAAKSDMKSALDHLPERLDALWSDGRYSARERRRMLYQLWSETDQTPEGAQAASTIELFIERRLPCGSPDGYTAEELQSFQRLHPERRFPATRDCVRRSRSLSR